MLAKLDSNWSRTQIFSHRKENPLFRQTKSAVFCYLNINLVNIKCVVVALAIMRRLVHHEKQL